MSDNELSRATPNVGNVILFEKPIVNFGLCDFHSAGRVVQPQDASVANCHDYPKVNGFLRDYSLLMQCDVSKPSIETKLQRAPFFGGAQRRRGEKRLVTIHRSDGAALNLGHLTRTHNANRNHELVDHHCCAKSVVN